MNVNELKKARGVIMDPIAVLATMLLNKNIVGKKGKQFLIGYEEGNKYGNLNTGDAIKKTEKEIHETHGPDVSGLYIIFALDKTHLTSDGNVTLSVHGVN